MNLYLSPRIPAPLVRYQVFFEGAEVLSPHCAFFADPCCTTMDQAIEHAIDVANRSSLPQTVYADDESGGWWHAATGARRLKDATLVLTVLPQRYFR